MVLSAHSVRSNASEKNKLYMHHNMRPCSTGSTKSSPNQACLSDNKIIWGQFAQFARIKLVLSCLFVQFTGVYYNLAELFCWNFSAFTYGAHK